MDCLNLYPVLDSPCLGFCFWGAFLNYVDHILPILDHIHLAPADKCLVFFKITFIRFTFFEISTITYLTRLVNVGFERSLRDCPYTMSKIAYFLDDIVYGRPLSVFLPCNKATVA
jgi:hypothetical protein